MIRAAVAMPQPQPPYRNTMQKLALTRDDLDKWIEELHGVAMRHLVGGELTEASAVCLNELSVLGKAVDPEDRLYLEGIAEFLLSELNAELLAKDLPMPKEPICSLSDLHHEHGCITVPAICAGATLSSR